MKAESGNSSLDVLQDTLSMQGKDLVFAMIQEYRGEAIARERAIEQHD